MKTRLTICSAVTLLLSMSIQAMNQEASLPAPAATPVTSPAPFMPAAPKLKGPPPPPSAERLKPVPKQTSPKPSAAAATEASSATGAASSSGSGISADVLAGTRVFKKNQERNESGRSIEVGKGPLEASDLQKMIDQGKANLAARKARRDQSGEGQAAQPATRGGRGNIFNNGDSQRMIDMVNRDRQPSSPTGAASGAGAASSADSRTDGTAVIAPGSGNTSIAYALKAKNADFVQCLQTIFSLPAIRWVTFTRDFCKQINSATEIESKLVLIAEKFLSGTDPLINQISDIATLCVLRNVLKPHDRIALVESLISRIVEKLPVECLKKLDRHKRSLQLRHQAEDDASAETDFRSFTSECDKIFRKQNDDIVDYLFAFFNNADEGAEDQDLYNQKLDYIANKFFANEKYRLFGETFLCQCLLQNEDILTPKLLSLLDILQREYSLKIGASASSVSAASAAASSSISSSSASAGSIPSRSGLTATAPDAEKKSHSDARITTASITATSTTTITPGQELVTAQPRAGSGRPLPQLPNATPTAVTPITSTASATAATSHQATAGMSNPAITVIPHASIATLSASLEASSSAISAITTSSGQLNSVLMGLSYDNAAQAAIAQSPDFAARSLIRLGEGANSEQISNGNKVRTDAEVIAELLILLPNLELAKQEFNEEDEDYAYVKAECDLLEEIAQLHLDEFNTENVLDEIQELDDVRVSMQELSRKMADDYETMCKDAGYDSQLDPYDEEAFGALSAENKDKYNNFFEVDSVNLYETMNAKKEEFDQKIESIRKKSKYKKERQNRRASRFNTHSRGLRSITHESHILPNESMPTVNGSTLAHTIAMPTVEPTSPAVTNTHSTTSEIESSTTNTSTTTPALEVTQALNVDLAIEGNNVAFSAQNDTSPVLVQPADDISVAIPAVQDTSTAIASVIPTVEDNIIPANDRASGGNQLDHTNNVQHIPSIADSRDATNNSAAVTVPSVPSPVPATTSAPVPATTQPAVVVVNTNQPNQQVTHNNPVIPQNTSNNVQSHTTQPPITQLSTLQPSNVQPNVIQSSIMQSSSPQKQNTSLAAQPSIWQRNASFIKKALIAIVGVMGAGTVYSLREKAEPGLQEKTDITQSGTSDNDIFSLITSISNLLANLRYTDANQIYRGTTHEIDAILYDFQSECTEIIESSSVANHNATAAKQLAQFIKNGELSDLSALFKSLKEKISNGKNDKSVLEAWNKQVSEPYGLYITTMQNKIDAAFSLPAVNEWLKIKYNQKGVDTNENHAQLKAELSELPIFFKGLVNDFEEIDKGLFVTK